MLQRRPPNGKNLLTERVRQIGQRGAVAVAPPAMAPRARQREPRQSVFKDASVIVPGGARITVVITDLNAFGARIEFFSRTTLPDELSLAASMLRLKRRARVVWQHDGAAGLQFLEDPAPA